MLCEELELPEGKLAEIVTALEDSAPTEQHRAGIERAYAQLCRKT